jgi:G3E family GTPase
MSIPLNLVSGFLGAGKTSAIRAQLKQRSGEKVAIIVNDFGEAALDEQALAEGEPFRITNIPGACVCCTAPEGFVEALGAVLDQEPARILIEPTGLARPQDLIDTVRRSPHGERIALGPVIVLVDPARIESAESGSLFREQLEAADVLVANRTDLASSEQLERFDTLAAELWPVPVGVYRTTQGALPVEAFEWPEQSGGPRERESGGDGHAHDSTHGFAVRSFAWPADAVFSRERLVDAVARLATGRAGAALERLKGIFRTQEGVFRLEVAGGQVDERPTSYRRDSRADVIVAGEAHEALDRASEWLDQALLTSEELRLSGERIEVVRPDGTTHLVDRDALLELPDGVPDASAIVPGRQGAAARLRELFRALELAESGHVIVIAGDGFASEPVPTPTLCEGILVHSADDQPLTPKQGGPFRLLIPEEANPPSGACANVKNVARLLLRN